MSPLSPTCLQRIRTLRPARYRMSCRRHIGPTLLRASLSSRLHWGRCCRWHRGSRRCERGTIGSQCYRMHTCSLSCMLRSWSRSYTAAGRGGQYGECMHVHRRLRVGPCQTSTALVQSRCGSWSTYAFCAARIADLSKADVAASAVARRLRVGSAVGDGWALRRDGQRGGQRGGLTV